MNFSEVEMKARVSFGSRTVKTRLFVTNRGDTRVSSALAAAWPQDATYLELTRSKSVTPGSQPALHSYLNKPRRKRGGGGSLKPFCCLFGNSNVRRSADKCSAGFTDSRHVIRGNIRCQVSQGRRKYEAAAPPRGHSVQVHTVQDSQVNHR